MRCYICDRIIPPEGIKFHPVTSKIEPCSACMEAINDATHNDGLDHSLDSEIFEDADTVIPEEDWIGPIEHDT